MEGICKFCNKKTKLIKSHIIPRCFYPKEKVYALTPAKKYIDKIKYQNGLKEYLMCADCDRKLGELDEYAKKILVDSVQKHEFRDVDEVKLYLLNQQEFDCDKIRRFLISLVWRISVSSNFSYFSLGKKYEKIALQILRGEISDDPNLFVPVVMIKNTGTFVDGVSTWGKTKICGKHACVVRFPNYEICVITNTKYNTNDKAMQKIRSLLTTNEFLVLETNALTNYDIDIIKGAFYCIKNQTP